MTSEKLFNERILPRLDDVINWKVVLLLELDESKLTDIGLIKDREPQDREVDSYIVCSEYRIQFHRFIKYITKIQKGDEVLYEYNDEEAFEKQPKMDMLELDFK